MITEIWFYDFYSLRLGPNWYQIGSKTSYIPRASKFYVEKGCLC